MAFGILRCPSGPHFRWTAHSFLLLLLISLLGLSPAGVAGQVQNNAARMAKMQKEHALLMRLVRDELATHETVRSGRWSSPNTWKDGKVPNDGARVVIHAGHSVSIRRQLDSRLMSLRVDGRLSFHPDVDTRLIVDTLVTTEGSRLIMGTKKHPVSADRTATLIISDYNNGGMVTNDPSSADYDPLRIGQGVITHGRVVIAGARKTPYVALAGNGVSAGESSLTLETVPEGWRVGDQLVVLGTDEDGHGAESRRISSISGAQVVLDAPLDRAHQVPDHTVPAPNMKVHVANLTRNVVIRTDASVENDYTDRQSRIEHSGHVMFMHNNDVSMRYAAFIGLGRTDKSRPLDETRFDANGNVTHVGTNQAARYPVHFHRAGWQGKQAYVEGCVVDGSPGWGYVNHSSKARMVKNISWNVYGAGFVTEAGDERGSFIANMAIATQGVGRSSVRDWKARESVNDWGFHGHGFWLKGLYLDFVANIVNGSSNFAYGIARKTIDGVTGVVIDDNGTEKPRSEMALKKFEWNIAYGNGGGVFGIISGTRDRTTEVIKGMLAWNNSGGISSGFAPAGEWFSWWYPDNIVLERPTLVSDIHDPHWVGIGTQSKLRKMDIIGARIEGFEVGIMVPIYYGPNHITGGYLNNVVNLLYQHGDVNKDAVTYIDGKLRFGSLPADGLQGRRQVKVKMDLKPRWNKLYRQYKGHRIIFDIDSEPTALRLFDSVHQAPDYVIEYGSHVGKTNAQLEAAGLQPVGGMIYPAESVVRDDMENVRALPLP